MNQIFANKFSSTENGLERLILLFEFMACSCILLLAAAADAAAVKWN